MQSTWPYKHITQTNSVQVGLHVLGLHVVLYMHACIVSVLISDKLLVHIPVVPTRLSSGNRGGGGGGEEGGYGNVLLFVNDILWAIHQTKC